MSLSLILPRNARVRHGFRLAFDPTTGLPPVASLDALLGERWRVEQIERGSRAEHEGAWCVVIETPWGDIRAFEGDWLVKADGEAASIVPPGAFRSMFQEYRLSK